MVGSLASSALSRGVSRPDRLYGSTVPRVFTPPLRELTPQTSLGFAAVEFARDVCGVSLFPWQEWLLIHALELAGDLTVDGLGDRDPMDPIFRFRKIVVLVSRQNGKSTLSQVLSLFFLYVLGTDLILGTAQDLDTAEEVWEGAWDIIEDTPELFDLAQKPILVNGKKTIRLKTGERYKVKAANRRAGRGLSGDLIILDELREHQTWDAWGAITKTTMARPAAQIWALSNAGDATSVVLRHLRAQAHAAVGDPDGVNAAMDPEAMLAIETEAEESAEAEAPDALGIFEWSAPPDCEVTDRAGWAAANPSLGYGISERTLAGDAKDDPEWVFRTECLCQWSDGSLEGPFPPGSWDAQIWRAKDPTDAPPEIVGPVKACVDVSVDRGWAYIAVAGFDAEGTAQIELAAFRPTSESVGFGWVVEWFQDPGRTGLIEEISGQGRGAPVSALLDELEAAGLPVVRQQGSDLSAGTGRFFDAVRDGTFRHFAQPRVDLAAATAVPKITDGGSFFFDRRKSPVDVAPLIAFAGAHWLLTRPIETPAVSAYEARGVMTI